MPLVPTKLVDHPFFCTELLHTLLIDTIPIGTAHMQYEVISVGPIVQPLLLGKQSVTETSLLTHFPLEWTLEHPSTPEKSSPTIGGSVLLFILLVDVQ